MASVSRSRSSRRRPRPVVTVRPFPTLHPSLVEADPLPAPVNPAVTLCFATFNGFPWRKVPRYIIAQIFGGFLAVIFVSLPSPSSFPSRVPDLERAPAQVYGQYHQQLGLLKEGLEAAGKPIISATGPAGIFVSIPTPGQKLGNVFINEFLADIFIGLIIIAVLDPTNNFMSVLQPVSAL